MVRLIMGESEFAERENKPDVSVLEGAILTHGFGGVERSADIREVITSGAIISPSLRGVRQHRAEMDKTRICFRAQKEGDVKPEFYIPKGYPFFVLPISGIEGLVVQSDALAAYDKQSISVTDQNREGVQVRLDQGIIVMTLEYFVDLHDRLLELAQKEKPDNPQEWIKKHCHVVTPEVYDNGSLFWNSLKALCTPARNVSLIPRMPSTDQIETGWYGYVGEVASVENLGISQINDFEIFNIEVLMAFTKTLSDYLVRINEIYNQVTLDNFESFEVLFEGTRTQTGEYKDMLEIFNTSVDIVGLYGSEPNEIDQAREKITKMRAIRIKTKEWLESKYGETVPIIDRKPEDTRPVFILGHPLEIGDNAYIYRDKSSGEIKFVRRSKKM